MARSFIAFVRDEFYGGSAANMTKEYKALNEKDKTDLFAWAQKEGLDVEAPKIAGAVAEATPVQA